MFEPLGASGCVRREVRSEKRASWKKCPHVVNRIRSLQLQQSHRFTRHRSCGVWHLHLLHCCPAPGAVCWVCRRPGGGGSAPWGALTGWTHSAFGRALQQAFVVVGSAQSSVSHRRSVAVCDHLARARARTRGSNFEMSHPIDRSGRGGAPAGSSGRTCARRRRIPLSGRVRVTTRL